MSRSPLHSLLVRAATIAREAERLGVPIDEVVSMSRRRFLAGSAAAVGVAALDACARRARPVLPPARAREASVLVVGAGIAGLTAAWRLRQHGVAVRVVEGQDRVGGRMLSLRGHFPDGQVAELGGELIDTGHERMHALVRELGLELDDLHAMDAAVARDRWDFGGRARSEAEVAAAFAPVGALIARDMADVDVDAIGWTNPGYAAALDRLSIAEWLDRGGVSGWIRDLIDVAYTTEFGLEPDRQSALNLLTMISPEPEPFRVFGESDERWHVRGGNDRVTSALASALGDAAITTGTRLVAVGERPGGGMRAWLEREGGSTTTIDATHVVLAIPFTLLRDVRLDPTIPLAKRRAIAELGYGTNAKLMVGFGERVWRTRHASNGSVFSDRPFQTTWETSRAQPGASGILTNFTGGAHGAASGSGSAEDQAALLLRDLEPIYPGLAAARASVGAVRFHWPTHEWTRGSYAAYLPGQWTSLRGVEGAAVGTLHFAGEHSSRDFQGFMEGGCESGERAAREVLESLG